MQPPLAHPTLGTWPATQACAMTGNQTGDALVCRLVLNPLSYTSQGRFISSFWIVPFIIMYCTSLSFTRVWVLKLILLDISIANPAFFPFHLHEVYILYPFTFSLYLLIWCGSLGNSIYMFCFLTHSATRVYWLQHLSHLHLRWLLIDTYVVPFYC